MTGSHVRESKYFSGAELRHQSKKNPKSRLKSETFSTSTTTDQVIKCCAGDHDVTTSRFVSGCNLGPCQSNKLSCLLLYLLLHYFGANAEAENIPLGKKKKNDVFSSIFFVLSSCQL